MLKNLTISKLLLCAAPVLAIAAPAVLADTIAFTAGRPPVTNANVIRDTLRGVAWADKEGKNADKADMWVVQSYKLNRERGKSAMAFEQAWNSAANKGFNGSWASVPAAVDEAVRMEIPAAYGDVEPMRVRLLYYKVRAIAENGTGPFDAAWAEYCNANKAYAATVEKANAGTTGRKLKDGPFAGADAGTLHGTTIDAFIAMGVYQLNKSKDPDAAYNQGYKPAAELAALLQQASQSAQFLLRYGIPAQEKAAAVFQEFNAWDKAAECFTQISAYAQTAGDPVGSKAARMKSAKCLIRLGGAGIGKAEGIFKPITREYEETVNQNGPPRKDWLNPEKAAYYAAAYAGLGLVRMEEKKHFEALQMFAKSLAFFSADANVRADALLGAGMCTVALAEGGGAKSKFYYESGIGYWYELKQNYEDTEAGKKNGELRDALEKVKR